MMNLSNEVFFSNLIVKIKTWIKNPLAIGILFLMILPPIGVVLFMLLGWFTIFKRLIQRKRFPLNIFTFFYLCLISASTVALITIPNLSAYVYIPVPLLLLGYYGVYLYIFDEINQPFKQWFHSFAASIIVGGLYIYFFSLIINKDHLKFKGPYDYLLGRHLLGTIPTPRLYGSTFNPNLAAYLLLMVIGFSLAYLLRALKERAYVFILLLIAVIVFMILALIQTGSRSAFIAMLVLIELFILRVNWKIGVILPFIPLVRLHWFIHLIPRHGLIDLSYTNRIIIWKTSLQIFKMHPIFGVSPAGFSVFYEAINNKYVPHSHDIFLAFLSEYGIVGEAVFLVLMATIFTYLIRILLNKPYKGVFFTGSFVLTLPIIIFTGILDHPLFSPQVALPTVILLAFFHRYAKLTQQESEQTL